MVLTDLESFCSYLEKEIERLIAVERNIDKVVLPAIQVEARQIALRHLPRLQTVKHHVNSWKCTSADLLPGLQTDSNATKSVADRVRYLDGLKTRINFGIGITKQLNDLVEYAAEASRALELQDYQKAAEVIAKYRIVVAPKEEDNIVLSGGGGGGGPPDIRSTAAYTFLRALHLVAHYNQAVSSLEGCEVKAISVVRRQFEQSIAHKDKEGVSRNAKLFYQLGIQKEGTARFIQFIRCYIDDQCTASFKKHLVLGTPRVVRVQEKSWSHADVLTDVFVVIADIIQQHQQNIEQEFGPENFILFCRGLQEEADKQGTRILDRFQMSILSKFTPSYSGGDDDASTTTLDLKLLDVALDEITLLSQRCQQFDVYLRKCSRNVLITVTVSSDLLDSHQAAGEYSRTDGLATLSALTKRIQEIMGAYVTLELTFMQRSLHIALRESDEVTWDDPDILTSTCVEDAFFILHKAVSRAISGSDVYAVCAVVNHVISLLSTEVRTVLEDNLQSSKTLYSDYIQDAEHLLNFRAFDAIPEAMLEDRTKAASLRSNYSWTHSVNNVEACCEYLERFQCKCEAEFEDRFSLRNGESETADVKEHRMDSAWLMFHHTLQNLEGVKSEFSTLHSYACKVTLNILKCHLFDSLQPLDSTNYNITQSVYDDYQVNDPFMRNFIDSLRLLHGHLQSGLNPTSVNLCVLLLVDKVCRRLETVFRGKSGFSLLGGVQVDKEIRALMSFCTDISSQSIRSKFGRLIEFGDIINLGSLEELDYIWGPSSNKTWRLNNDEIKQVIGLRADFSKNLIEEYFAKRATFASY